jgi:hypothetical protein
MLLAVTGLHWDWFNDIGVVTDGRTGYLFWLRTGFTLKWKKTQTLHFWCQSVSVFQKPYLLASYGYFFGYVFPHKG